jgi:hypothetical protein
VSAGAGVRRCPTTNTAPVVVTVAAVRRHDEPAPAGVNAHARPRAVRARPDLPLPRRVSDTVSFVALGALLEGVGGQADAFLTPARVSTIDAAGVVDLGRRVCGDRRAGRRHGPPATRRVPIDDTLVGR